MTYETARKAVMFLSRLWSETGGQHTPRIIFFGGEPLLKWELIEETVLFAREWTVLTGIPFAFILSTNGTIANNNIIEFLAREDIGVQISIDGPPDVHNQYRKFSSGIGSYQVISKNLPLFFRKNLHLNARATIIENSVPLSDRLRLLRRLGFKSVHIKYVSDNAETTPHISGADLSLYETDIDNAVIELLEARQNGVYVYPFAEHLRSFKKKHWRRFICSTGSVAISVAPDGWVYPCHRFSGNQAYQICHVTGTFDNSISLKFGNLSTDTLPLCRVCWARRFCWGCCPAESVSYSKPLGYPTFQWCAAKKLEALVSLKLAIASGYQTI